MLWNLPKQKEILFLKDQEATARQSTETWSVTQMDRNFSRYVSYDARGCWNVVLCIPAKPWPSGFLSWRVGHVEGCGSLVLKKQNTRAESCWVEAFGECVRALQSRSEVFQCEASLLIFFHHCLEAVNVSGQTCPSSTAADYNKRLQFIPQVRTGKTTILYSQILSFCLFCSLHLQLFLFYRTNLWILALHNQYCVFNGSPNDQYIYINTHFIYCRIGVNRFGIFRADTKTDYLKSRRLKINRKYNLLK